MGRTKLTEAARDTWFHKKPSMAVDVLGKRMVVTRKLLWIYGGPKQYTRCEACQAMEWRSRLNEKNLFEKHDCKDPNHLKQTTIFCKRAGHPDWVSTLKNYDFTIGIDPNLPGLRGLVVWPGSFVDRLLDPKADRGVIEFRQRLAPFQIDLWRGGPVGDLSGYDFVFVLNNPKAPVFKRGDKPKILMYCHDHHKFVEERQKILGYAPHAIFTPYPTIWKTHFKIAKSTKVVFAPFISDTFFPRPSTDYKSRELDVLVIGTTNSRVYPERATLAEIVRRVNNPKWRVHPIAHSGLDYRKGCSVVRGGLLLNRWSQFLATSKVVVFAPDKFGYLVRKYTEILASGSLMVCARIPDLDTLGLKPNVHYVPLPRPVDERVVPLLERILANWSRYEPMARAGLKWQRGRSDWWLFEKFEADVREVCRG